MHKKLKTWLFDNIFKDIAKMHREHYLHMKNILACKENEIKNLKERLNYYNNKGAL